MAIVDKPIVTIILHSYCPALHFTIMCPQIKARYHDFQETDREVKTYNARITTTWYDHFNNVISWKIDLLAYNKI